MQKADLEEENPKQAAAGDLGEETSPIKTVAVDLGEETPDKQ